MQSLWSKLWSKLLVLLVFAVFAFLLFGDLTNASWRSCLIKYRRVPFGTAKREEVHRVWTRGDTWNRDDVSEWKMVRKWQMLQCNSDIKDHWSQITTDAVPSLSPVWLCDPMDCHTPASLSFTISWSLLKFMSIESVMLSNHLILCRPLPLLPSIFLSFRVFSTITNIIILKKCIIMWELLRHEKDKVSKYCWK